MKTIFSGGEIQQMIVEDLNRPIKRLFRAIRDPKVVTNPRDFIVLIRDLRKMMKSLQELPEPTKENTQHINSKILVDLRDKFLQHATGEAELLRQVFNYAIVKYDYDEYYSLCIDWLLKEWQKTPWEFASHKNPSTEVWNVIPSRTRERIESAIRTHYETLKERLKTIRETLDGKEAEIHTSSRVEQFIRFVLNDVEREVESWKK